MENNLETTQDPLHTKEPHSTDATQPVSDSAGSRPAASGVGRRRMRWAALAAIVPIAACVIWLRGQRRDFAAQQVAEASTLPADVVVVDAKQMQQITVEPVETKQISLDWDTTGRITFDEDHLTPVAPPYAGRVQELLAGKGDRVLKDQPLVKLESPDLVAVQADLTAVRSDVAKAKIGLGIAQSVAERIRDLSAHKAAATKDLQQAEADLARAQDEERRAEATLATVESRLELFGKQPQEIERPGAPVDRSIVIRAPISGTVVDRKIGPGQYIRPDAAEPLFLISDLTTLWVQADVFESDLALIHLQAPVEIIVEAYPDLKIPARISYISPVVDPTTRTMRVRGLLKNETGRFKPNMFARIR
ncbi:MAG: efflux RND transporter periplasmic adaptor subunit, partial [Acidobacteriota bacterium]